MQHRPLGIATSHDSNESREEDQPTKSVVQHVVPARNSFGQATQAEEHSVASPSSDSVDEALHDQAEEDLTKQLTSENSTTLCGETAAIVLLVPMTYAHLDGPETQSGSWTLPT